MGLPPELEMKRTSPPVAVAPTSRWGELGLGSLKAGEQSCSVDPPPCSFGAARAFARPSALNGEVTSQALRRAPKSSHLPSIQGTGFRVWCFVLTPALSHCGEGLAMGTSWEYTVPLGKRKSFEAAFCIGHKAHVLSLLLVPSLACCASCYVSCVVLKHAGQRRQPFPLHAGASQTEQSESHPSPLGSLSDFPFPSHFLGD